MATVAGLLKRLRVFQFLCFRVLHFAFGPSSSRHRASSVCYFICDVAMAAAAAAEASSMMTWPHASEVDDIHFVAAAPGTRKTPKNRLPTEFSVEVVGAHGTQIYVAEHRCSGAHRDAFVLGDNDVLKLALIKPGKVDHNATEGQLYPSLARRMGSKFLPCVHGYGRTAIEDRSCSWLVMNRAKYTVYDVMLHSPRSRASAAYHVFLCERERGAHPSAEWETIPCAPSLVSR